MAEMHAPLPPLRRGRPDSAAFRQAPLPTRRGELADDSAAARALDDLFPDLRAAADAALADLFPMLRLRSPAARR